jgi:hypothetical protein
VYADPREVKRQRERERYANNKDEILKHRRQIRELKKQSTAAVLPKQLDNLESPRYKIGLLNKVMWSVIASCMWHDI